MDLFDPALAAFALLISGTPGPGTLLLLATGSRIGVRRGVPFLIGLAFAYGVLWGGAASGLRHIVALDPALMAPARWVALALIALFAWRLLRVLRQLEAGEGSPAVAPTLPGGLLFQIANPKAWMTAVSTAILFCSAKAGVGAHALVFGATGAIAMALVGAAYLACGARGTTWLRRPRVSRAVNGLALVAVFAGALPLLAG